MAPSSGSSHVITDGFCLCNQCIMSPDVDVFRSSLVGENNYTFPFIWLYAQLLATAVI